MIGSTVKGRFFPSFHELGATHATRAAVYHFGHVSSQRPSQTLLLNSSRAGIDQPVSGGLGSCGAAQQLSAAGATYMGEEVTDDIRIVHEMRKDRERVVVAPGISSAIFKE